MHQAARARSRLAVAANRLDATDGKCASAGPLREDGLAKRAHFYRVTQRGTRAVRLPSADVLGWQGGVRKRQLQEGALRRAIRRRQAGAPPILPHTAPSHVCGKRQSRRRRV
eukprot:scaffold325573_cov104-Tisochrysis_lutea.AAC.1